MLLAYAQSPTWRGWLQVTARLVGTEMPASVRRSLVSEIMRWKLQGPKGPFFLVFRTEAGGGRAGHLQAWVGHMGHTWRCECFHSDFDISALLESARKPQLQLSSGALQFWVALVKSAENRHRLVFFLGFFSGRSGTSIHGHAWMSPTHPKKRRKKNPTMAIFCRLHKRDPKLKSSR